MNPWSAVELEAYADEFEIVATSLRSAAKLMRDKKLAQVHLNADTAFGPYRAGIVRLAALMEGEIRNQAVAATKGIEPEWLVNQRKNAAAKARSEAQANIESQGLVKKPAKKPKTPRRRS